MDWKEIRAHTVYHQTNLMYLKNCGIIISVCNNFVSVFVLLNKEVAFALRLKTNIQVNELPIKAIKP